MNSFLISFHLNLIGCYPRPLVKAQIFEKQIMAINRASPNNRKQRLFAYFLNNVLILFVYDGLQILQTAIAICVELVIK